MRLGCDPEVFLLNKENKLTSVIGKIGANKWAPLQVKNLPDGFTLQEDNVALEFGIPPAASAEEFISSIRRVMRAGRSHLGPGAFSTLSCVTFPHAELTDPNAWVFGCEPDFDAWTGQENPKPKAPNVYLRSAGGHIHVETELDKQRVIRFMDLTLGVPSVLMDEDGGQRRALYGAPGAYRPKPYGVEYRTLSNFWIFNPRTIRWAWDSSQRAVNLAEFEPGIIDQHSLGAEIQYCITSGDKKLAASLVKEYQLAVV